MPNAFDDTLPGRVALRAFWRAYHACLAAYQAAPVPTIVFAPSALLVSVINAAVIAKMPVFSHGPLGTVFGVLDAPSLLVVPVEQPTVLAIGWRTILALAPDNTLDFSPFVSTLLDGEGTALIIQPMEPNATDAAAA